ncbi:MAG: PAS domain-containing sensor histidine kinase [Planctomycetes bacterium]|nr:PAS domain-containing sensor histidine kinase [Planctomycetota bacterium]
MNETQQYQRYQELQQWVGWTDEDGLRVAEAGQLVRPALPALIDDFYDEIARHPDARQVITGGQPQIERLKATLHTWVTELFSGVYDEDYVAKRWRVGHRHVEIGLNQVYANAALGRLRRGLEAVLATQLSHDAARLNALRQSLMTLLDLDLAIIGDAYQSEFTAKQQRMERLATIGQVAGGVAHELRNPLNVVKTSVYYLQHIKPANPEKTRDHLERISRQVEVADNVISALSDFAKLPMPNKRPTQLAACIDQVLSAETFPENVEVTVSCPANLPLVLVDDKQLRIAVSNLVRNAREAMPDGGQLTIECRQSDGYVEISVSDTGVGIAPEHITKILQPFFSTKARGIGLGLALTRAILDKNSGTLKVDSELGRGSTFVVRLLPAPPGALDT